MKPQTTLTVAATLFATFAASLGLSHYAGIEEETVVPLQRQSLVDIPGKQLVLATVTYLPGQASSAHRHAGSVFAYVLQGEVISQLEGEAAVTYKAGQSWYEPPHTPHLVSRNASDRRPARLLAVLVMDEGGDVKEPLPAAR